ncbi:MAG TPA: hypothetical protein VL651_05890 [Bacteroidia bacterium]|nr:hypothetical protein [Bacteroidia bacterium]
MLLSSTAPLQARIIRGHGNDSASTSFTPVFANVGMGFGDIIAVRYGATMDLHQKFTMGICYTYYAHDGVNGIPCTTNIAMHYCPRGTAHFIELGAGKTFYSKGRISLEAIGGISCTIYDRPTGYDSEVYYVGNYGPYTKYDYHYHTGVAPGISARVRMNIVFFPELGFGAGAFVNYNKLYPSAGIMADLLIGKMKF